MRHTIHIFSSFAVVLFLSAACSDSATSLGVGASCQHNEDCTEEGQRCLTNFKGGYCGISDCVGDLDCPQGSRCVAHEDGTNYCFLICIDKSDCNVHRSVEDESNCSSNIDFVDPGQDKACVPPSGV